MERKVYDLIDSYRDEFVKTLQRWVRVPSVRAEPAEGEHEIGITRVEDEYYVSVPHEMTKTHHISFLAALGTDGLLFKKLYPEGAADGRFRISGTRYIYCYCNRHGLFVSPVPFRRLGGGNSVEH